MFFDFLFLPHFVVVVLHLIDILTSPTILLIIAQLTFDFLVHLTISLNSKIHRLVTFSLSVYILLLSVIS